jgi:acetaldehyde dehydrogenase (acetylating)
MIVAQKAGLSVPEGTRVLVAPLTGVGRDFPLSIEKLCPVLSWYVVSDWRAGCERCIEILRYGGMGHTMSIHSRDDKIILEFGLKKPAGRICVNTPTTHGSIGLTTGLDPAMTLGCGGWGGNITSDNISPRHLLNIKRLAYEITPAVVRKFEPQSTASAPGLPRPPAGPPKPGGISADVLARRIDEFLGSRGYRAPQAEVPAKGGNYTGPGAAPVAPVAPAPLAPAAPAAPEAPTSDPGVNPAEFVCQEDVRQALEQNRKIVIGERTIVTPAARDLGEEHRVFVQAAWPR